MKWCKSKLVLVPMAFSSVNQVCKMLYNGLFCPPLSELNSPEVTCQNVRGVTDGMHPRAQTPACSEGA